MDLATRQAVASMLRAQQRCLDRRVGLGLFEAGVGLSRILTYFNGNNAIRSVVVISASRDAGNPATKADNAAKTAQLQSAVRALGLGYVPAEGVWVENAGTPQERSVVEKSLIIANMTKAQGQSLARQFAQEAFIFAEPGSIRAYDQSGTATEWSKWSRIKLDVPSSAPQTKMKGRSFAFENRRAGFDLQVEGQRVPLPLGVTVDRSEEWFGDWTLADLREGDLVWWEQATGWNPPAGICRVRQVTEDCASLEFVEEGRSEPFVAHANNTAFVALVACG